MAQPPSPQAITGSLSLPGNLPRSSGRKTTWPGEPRAGSDMTLYGPGIAFGAPSSGSVVATRSFLGGCAYAVAPSANRAAAAERKDNFTYASKQSSGRLRGRIIDHQHGPRSLARHLDAVRARDADDL